MSVPEADERILPHFAISEQGLRELEIWLGQETLQWGPWVYVGTSQIPFQNGWGNVGGDLQPLRFRLEVPAAKSVQSLQIEGEIAGGTAGTVVCSLPKRYRPKKDGYSIGKYGTEAALSVAVWKFQTNGDLIFVGQAGGSGSDTTAIHWGANTDPTGAGVTLSDLGSLILNLLAFNGLQVFNSTGDLLFGSFENGLGVFNLFGASAQFQIVDDSANTLFAVVGAGQINAMLKAGKAFTLTDSLGNPILQITEGGETLLTLPAAQDFRINSAFGGDAFQIIEGGERVIRLAVGGQFTLYNSSGFPVLQMTDGSPDLHLPTGGNVIFDL